MAIITEEEEPTSPKSQENVKPRKPTSTSTSTSHSNPKPEGQNPFAFWFYFTLIVSFVTLFFIPLSSLSPQDPKSWFLSLPSSLRQHYSNGRIIKVQTSPDQSPVEVFVVESGRSASENVVLVHGLGLSSYSFREMIRLLGSKGVHVTAIDLPGNGFSDKTKVEIEEGGNGLLGRLKEVYDLIQEKGVFWAFDEMVETGQIPYEEIQSRVMRRKSVKAIELSGEEMDKVLGQVIETLGLAPVHLVLHDSALSMSANWVLQNSGSVRSVTLLDTGSRPALPFWVLGIPVVREISLGLSFVYARLISSCCSRGINSLDMEAYRVLLKGSDGRRAVVGIGRNLNYSFDIAEWGSLDGIKGMPMQVLWSSGWSNEWSEEGQQVGEALPQAKFVTHSGGRWPQEDVAHDVAEKIAKFVRSLPKTVRHIEEEPIPEHIQKMFDEAKQDGNHDHHHHHHHQGHDHGHIHSANYMDAYGLGGHAWGS